MRRLKLVTGEGVTRAAAIAFGKEEGPAYPLRRLRLARFVGTTKDEFRDSRQYEGDAFRLPEPAERFLRETVPIASRFVAGPMQRIDIPKFPPLAEPHGQRATDRRLAHAAHAHKQDPHRITSPTGLLPASRVAVTARTCSGRRPS